MCVGDRSLCAQSYSSEGSWLQAPVLSFGNMCMEKPVVRIGSVKLLIAAG